MRLKRRSIERGLLLLLGCVIVLVSGLRAPAAEGPPESEVYRIGQNDVIRIQVFGEDDLTVETKVSGDGTINYPLLGAIPIGGKTAKELQDYLVQRLAEGYVRAPKVTVLMVRYRNFYLSGEVKTPGAYAYESGMTVQKAVSLAGGFTEKAESRQVIVTRRSEKGAEMATLGLDASVQPDDILVVSQMQRFYVTGEVKTPGRYQYEPGLTVQKAVSMAGGLTEKGDPDGIKLTRLGESVVKTLPVGSEASVQPDDMIVVEGQNRKFYVSGEVKTPGSFPFKEGMNVQKALAIAGGLSEKAEKNGLKVVRQVNGREEAVQATLTTVLQPEDTLVVPEGQKFFVSGEVRTPGRFLFEPGLTIQKAVSMAGGMTERADKSEIRVNRMKDGQVTAVVLEAHEPILPNDVVVVAQAQKIFVEGEVKHPGHFPFEKGMTVHMAIAMAGGFTDKASQSGTKVLRKVDGQEQSERAKLDGPVQPNDIIVVPQRFF